ncbi:hypothetical protein L914_11143 [Phytophthora nicotianae]|uniref:Uncharacterized protein n=1 Tax=Phytophthora nicotianae TaxID=4792 RepID=W2N462_PHYNI|nr:hypothetical protein L914_11143 [Phytophthora nicotianae]
MPRSPKAKRTTHKTPVVQPKIIDNVVSTVEIEQPRPATPVQRTRKRVHRRPKYHEKASFLERESFKGLGLDAVERYTTWFPGTTLGESYRIASTIFQAAHQASHETRPVSWGYGYTDGALGHNNTRRVVEMKRLALFRRNIVRAVSAGNRLSLFLTDDNRIFQSGRLFMKQDGCNMWKPVEIKLETPANMVAVEAGHLAAYALDDQGRLYSWGTQIFGQLGHGEELEQEHRIPRLVEGLNGHNVVKISAGNHFAVAITSTGLVFSWGRGCFGQLGNGKVADVSTPTPIEALKDYTVIDIAAGSDHVIGVIVPREAFHRSDQHEESLATEHSVVMVWGQGKHGCLGLGGSSNELLPTEIVFFRGLGAVKAAAGAGHSLVLCRAGAQTFLYAFGGNHLGQLGIASSADHVDMPSFLDEFVNVHVADIGAGAQFSAALTSDGQVFTWGDARYGKTCRADGRTTYVPWSVDLPSNIPSIAFVTQLSVGSYHCLAQLRISGQIDRWRKFSLGGITPALRHEEHNRKEARKLQHKVFLASSSSVILAKYRHSVDCVAVDVT